MPSIEHWKMPWLKGHCFDFALALAEITPDFEFVAIGDTNFPDHVALRSGEHFVDIRGILDEASFLAHHTGMSIVPISRQDVEFHCGLSGMSPPYRGVRQIAEARKAVRRTFPEGVTLPAETPETDNPEDRIGGQDWSVCIRP